MVFWDCLENLLPPHTNKPWMRPLFTGCACFLFDEFGTVLAIDCYVTQPKLSNFEYLKIKSLWVEYVLLLQMQLGKGVPWSFKCWIYWNGKSPALPLSSVLPGSFKNPAPSGWPKPTMKPSIFTHAGPGQTGQVCVQDCSSICHYMILYVYRDPLKSPLTQPSLIADRLLDMLRRKRRMGG